MPNYTEYVHRIPLRTYLELLAFVALLSTSVIGVVMWHSSSAHILSVESASMSPALHRGDAVMASGSAGHIKVGDVVSYHNPVNPVVIITHRVVAVNSQAHTLTTKGDALREPDPPINRALLVGRVSHRVGLAGYVVDFLRTPYGLIAGIYIPALVVVAAEFRRLIVYFRHSRYQLKG